MTVGKVGREEVGRCRQFAIHVERRNDGRKPEGRSGVANLAAGTLGAYAEDKNHRGTGQRLCIDRAEAAETHCGREKERGGGRERETRAEDSRAGAARSTRQAG